MRMTALVLSSVALAACSHGGTFEHGVNTYTGAVTGVIVLPDASASDEACTQLAVYATTTDDKGQALRVGRPLVHRANGHCSYTIGELPPALAITVHVDAPDTMKCGNGATPAFASQSQQTISLKDEQLVTRDFQPQCAATTTSSR